MTDTKKIVTLKGGPCDGEMIDSDGASRIIPSGHHLPKGYTDTRKPVYTPAGDFTGEYIDTSDWGATP